MNTQIAEKPPASPAANPNPYPSVKREKYRIAGTAARDAVARLQNAKAQVRAEGGKPKASWDAVLLEILTGAQGITAYSRTCDRISVKAIARWTGLTTNTVRAAMRDLEAMGCILTDTPATMIGQGHRTPSTLVSVPMSPARRQDVMERGPASVDNRGEGATQTAGGRVQSGLHPSEKFEKNLKSIRAASTRRGATQTASSPQRAVATEHLPTPSKATPPKDMTPEKVKAREAAQREIDERRSRDTGHSGRRKEDSRIDEAGGTNGNGNPAGETNTTAQARNRTPAIHENADHSWIEDAGEMHQEADAMRDRFDALAGMPRGW